MRRAQTGCLLALTGCLLALTACDDGSTADPPEADGALSSSDAGPPDAGPPDATLRDAALPDAAPSPPPHLDAPMAWVYANDPVTDEGHLTQVTLARTDEDDGRLTNQAVQVFNCLNEDGGLVAHPDLGGLSLEVSLCHEVQVVRPDADGHYLSIQPPADDADPNDTFAEVMMYHQVNRVRDYYADTFGFHDLDVSLPALVNVQFKVVPPLRLGPFQPNADGWYPFANAAFFPKEQWELFAAQFGLPPRDSDSIIFFQAAKDFAYDARVIFHEYTHAVIGFDRLGAARVPDRYGLNPSPASMHEGLADYFAASLAGGPVIGAYIGEGGEGLRNLADLKRCPEDSVWEVHANGQIIGSTLWAARERLGAEAMDAIVFGAIQQFTQTTTFEEAAALMIAFAEALDPALVEPLRAVFATSRFDACERSQAWVDFDAARSWHGLPYQVEGSTTVGYPGFTGSVPGYKQFYVDVPAGAGGVRLSWRLQGSQSLLGLIGTPGPPEGPLDLALRAGQPIAYTYQGGVHATWDHRVTAPLEGDAQAVVLTGDCLPLGGGRLHTLFLNPGRGAAGILAMHAEVVDAPPADGAAVMDCADAPPPAPDAGTPGPIPDAGGGDAGAGDAGAGDAG